MLFIKRNYLFTKFCLKYIKSFSARVSGARELTYSFLFTFQHFDGGGKYAEFIVVNHDFAGLIADGIAGIEKLAVMFFSPIEVIRGVVFARRVS